MNQDWRCDGRGCYHHFGGQRLEEISYRCFDHDAGSSHLDHEDIVHWDHRVWLVQGGTSGVDVHVLVDDAVAEVHDGCTRFRSHSLVTRK